MAMLSKPSFGPRTSLIYITSGALIIVWTGVYYAFKIMGHEGNHENAMFWIVGLLLTGATLIAVGLLLGQIGRAARKAELPPEEVTKDEARVQQSAAANPNPAVNQQAGMAQPAPVSPQAPPPASPPAPSN